MKNIELASIDQIDLIMKIIKACTNHMIKNGIFQWNDKYPTKQSFIDDINNDCLLYTSPSPRDGLLSRMPSSA